MKKIRTILIVDSSKSDASSLNKFLRAEGFSTIVATDVQEATVACISKVIDLIVLELNLLFSPLIINPLLYLLIDKILKLHMLLMFLSFTSCSKIDCIDIA